MQRKAAWRGVRIRVAAVWRRKWARVTAAVLAVPIEYFQGWVIGRYPDVTDVIFGGVGGWLGAWAGGYGPVAFSRTLASLDRRRVWRPAYPE